MANPQLENGHTKIANDILDALCRYRIPGEERQIVDCIIRKTYGWNKRRDEISLTQFSEATGLPKHRITEALKRLAEKGLVKITRNQNVTNIGKTNGHIYEFNKDHEQWKVLPKKVTLPLLVKVVTNIGKGNEKVLPILDTTKDILKDNPKDKIPYVEIIDYLNLKTGKHFSASTSATRAVIHARAKEGFTPEQFRLVVDIKAPQWSGDPDMDKYLRPSTLFGAKFEAYLNENPACRKSNPLDGKLSKNGQETYRNAMNWAARRKAQEEASDER
jgi:phage replication O-like protein O